MRSLLRLLNITSWPIWVRLAAAAFVAVLVPALIAFVTIQNEVSSVNLANLRSFLTERGLERRDAINDRFNRIQSELQNFTEESSQRGLLVRLLGFESDSEVVLDSLRTTMNEELVGTGLFGEVRVVDSDGNVVLVSDLPRLGQEETGAAEGTDDSVNATYRAYQSAVQLNQTQRWVAINEAGNPQLELVQVVQDATGVVGYVVGRVDKQAAILDLLAVDTAFIDASSYLVISTADVIATSDYIEQAERSSFVSPVSQALSQRTGTQNYVVDDTEYVGHYAPVLNTPFGIITETPVEINFVETIDRVYAQGVLIILGLIFVASVIALGINLSITPGIQSLQRDVAALAEGDFDREVSAADRHDEIGALARTFVSTREQIRGLVEEQASRIDARVRDLQATQEVSRFAATQRDPSALMERVVYLIIDLFPNVYHAQIFLLDENREYAVLRASTGEAGQQLLSRGHRLAVGSVSVIGQVTEENRVVIARETSASEVWRRNEFLPETRAELAIPLRVGARIIGALDVQSKQGNSFTEDQINILQTMADQIAIAIENTQLYQETVRRLEELNAARRDETQRAWREYLDYERQQTISQAAGTYITQDWDELHRRAVAEERPIIGEQTDRQTVPFAVPIKLRDQTLGAVEWEVPASQFDSEKVYLAEELVTRLAFSLDNARLFQESQSATGRERLVNEITSRLTGQTDIDDILQTAVQEVGRALRAPEVQVNLKAGQDEAYEKRNGNQPDGNDPSD